MKKEKVKTKTKNKPAKKGKVKRRNSKKSLGEVDFEKIQKEAEEANKKLEPEIKRKITKPKFKRVRVYENGVEMYFKDGRKISIASEDDGSFIVETKKILKAEEPFSSFSPAKIKYLKKWGIKIASCKVNLSKEALMAIGMGITEMLRKGVFDDKFD